MSFHNWMDNFEFDLPEWVDSIAACNKLLLHTDQAAIQSAAACAEFDHGTRNRYRAIAGYDQVAVRAFDARRGLVL